MNNGIQIQLETTAVLNVPFQLLDSGFIFDVNGIEFRTTRVISEYFIFKYLPDASF